MTALRADRTSLGAVLDFVDGYRRDEYQRTGVLTKISFPSFATASLVSAILRNPVYLGYTSVLLPSIEFNDMDDMALCLRDSAITVAPAHGDLRKITLTNARFRTSLNRPVAGRHSDPDFHILVIDELALLNLGLWSNILKPFLDIRFSSTEVPSRQAEPVIDNEGHHLKEFSVSNFPDAYMVDFLKMIRESSRIKFSVRHLRKLVIDLAPTSNFLLSAELKYEIATLLRDNLSRSVEEPRSKLQELRVICDAFDGYSDSGRLAEFGNAGPVSHNGFPAKGCSAQYHLHYTRRSRIHSLHLEVRDNPEFYAGFEAKRKPVGVVIRTMIRHHPEHLNEKEWQVIVKSDGSWSNACVEEAHLINASFVELL
ncbi:uncharacterized protein BT62DRAFT_1033178 [Guyanagaster necrorhizus]|uniref:Uncharacterized protein n=1 Tax=Guyanagaster necrorhizus TaxID=856835 RepID=A0A9P8AQ72_9AGAR|nr:uncharacterized protein BT62DRAFT_1033178 [Guyanagaster necrorhizus MCA 3950]KAG7443705.1 hypothetical protein BT62DRAFT_1033178 [Guyanagaster necrorhizus MCA 3950]